MYKNKKILCIIPARGGSKRLPGKNIKKIGGKPMIAHAILAAKKSKYVDRIIVSTDDPAIAKVAKKYGAEIPFIRPTALASDTAATLPVLQHAVTYIEKWDNKFKPDMIVLVQPTNPLVRSEDIDGAIKKMVATKTHSCFTVSEISQRPEWMYYLENKKPKLFLANANLNIHSQNLPRLGIINGAVYVMKYNTLMKKNKIQDENTSIYIMPKEKSVDIDNLVDFKIAEALMKDDENK